MLKNGYRLGLLFLCLGSFLGSPVAAEMYVAGQIGYAMPSDLSDVKGTGSLSGTNFNNLALTSNVAYGLKIGGYFPGVLKWLGVEFEGFYNQPDIKAQTITASGATSGSSQGDAAKFRVATFAVNVLARYPGTTFQPYIGIGGGVNVAGLSETPNTYFDDVAVAPALNALAGLRIFVTEKIAFFGEYKYNRSVLKFSDNELQANYQTSMFMGGISFHFK
jgi:hypothetical protein